MNDEIKRVNAIIKEYEEKSKQVENTYTESEMKISKLNLHIEKLEDELGQIDAKVVDNQSLVEEYGKRIREAKEEREKLIQLRGDKNLIDKTKKEKHMELDDNLRKVLTMEIKFINQEIANIKSKLENTLWTMNQYKENNINTNGDKYKKLEENYKNTKSQLSELEKAKEICNGKINEFRQKDEKAVEAINEILKNRGDTEKQEKPEEKTEEEKKTEEQQEETEQKTKTKYRKYERPQMDLDAKNVKIVYDASTDKYVIENSDTWKAEYFKRKDIKPINKEVLAEKMGKSVEDLDYLDTNILRILMQYNKELAKNYLKEVTEFGKDRDTRSRDMKEKGIEITYDLKGLYDKNPGDELNSKSVNSFTLEERQEILYNANMAKDMGSATVKKGLKVLFFEKLDQTRMRFSKQKLLSDGKENIKTSNKKKSKEEKRKEKLKKKIRKKAMKIQKKHDKKFRKLEKIENSLGKSQQEAENIFKDMKVSDETQQKLGEVVEQHKEAEGREGPTAPEGPEYPIVIDKDSNAVDKDDDEMLGL